MISEWDGCINGFIERRLLKYGTFFLTVNELSPEKSYQKFAKISMDHITREIENRNDAIRLPLNFCYSFYESDGGTARSE